MLKTLDKTALVSVLETDLTFVSNFTNVGLPFLSICCFSISCAKVAALRKTNRKRKVKILFIIKVSLG